MRAFITFLLALAILLTIAACESKSSKMTQIKRQEEVRGYNAIVVENSPEIYKKINDKVVRRNVDKVFFEKEYSSITGECRYYRVR